MTWRALTEALVIGSVTALSLYDVAARVFGGNDATISAVVSDAGARWPVVVLVVGAVVSHWFWGGAR
jgi:hypothetical protein